MLFGLHLTFRVSGYVIEGSKAKEKIHWGDSMLWQTGTAGINKTLTSAVGHVKKEAFEKKSHVELLHHRRMNQIPFR